MYRIGYIDDEPNQYKNYARKISRRYPDIELILFEDCATKEDFVEKIYEVQAEVLLIDYKMAGKYGFNGTTLINYINDRVRDLECFILTAVEQDRITDGLVSGRNRRSKEIFDTEADDPERVKRLDEFMNELKESADVFRTRREQKKERYQELLEKKKSEELSANEEDEFISLYKVLASYGLIEELPESMLKSDFEQALDELLEAGEVILKKYNRE